MNKHFHFSDFCEHNLSSQKSTIDKKCYVNEMDAIK